MLEKEFVENNLYIIHVWYMDSNASPGPGWSQITNAIGCTQFVSMATCLLFPCFFFYSSRFFLSSSFDFLILCTCAYVSVSLCVCVYKVWVSMMLMNLRVMLIEFITKWCDSFFPYFYVFVCLCVCSFFLCLLSIICHICSIFKLT